MKARLVLASVASVALAVLAGCRGKVLASADLKPSGTADIHVDASGGKISLWADTDGAWRGPKEMPVRYAIDVVSGGKTVGHVVCDTSDSSERICGVSVSNGNDHSGDCEVKMRCELPSLPSGDVTLRVTATPGTTIQSVKKLGLNLRQG